MTYQIVSMPLLETLLGSPKAVMTDASITHCPRLHSLLGAPRTYGAALTIRGCPSLTTLDEFNGEFLHVYPLIDLSNNGIVSLSGVHRRFKFTSPITVTSSSAFYVAPNLDLSHNPIVSSILGLALLPAQLAIRLPMLVDDSSAQQTIQDSLTRCRNNRQVGMSDRSVILQFQRVLLDLGLDELARL